ncbi:MAG: hypothetical protein ACP5T4_03505 [Candidatus Micrarchaeia archaeon]
MEEPSAEQVFKALNAEKASGELLPLDPNFYASVELYIASLSQSQEKQAEANNMRKMLFQLKEKRKQKILIYLAYKKPLPKPVPEEEETLYNEILKIVNRDSGAKSQTVKLKILADIPEVIMPDGKKIGPFKSGEIFETNNQKEADFIIINKIGEKV